MAWVELCIWGSRGGASGYLWEAKCLNTIILFVNPSRYSKAEFWAYGPSSPSCSSSLSGWWIHWYLGTYGEGKLWYSRCHTCPSLRVSEADGHQGLMQLIVCPKHYLYFTSFSQPRPVIGKYLEENECDCWWLDGRWKCTALCFSAQSKQIVVVFGEDENS